MARICFAREVFAWKDARIVKIPDAYISAIARISSRKLSKSNYDYELFEKSCCENVVNLLFCKDIPECFMKISTSTDIVCRFIESRLNTITSLYYSRIIWYSDGLPCQFIHNNTQPTT